MPKVSLPDVDKGEVTFWGVYAFFPMVIALIIFFTVFWPQIVAAVNTTPTPIP